MEHFSESHDLGDVPQVAMFVAGSIASSYPPATFLVDGAGTRTHHNELEPSPGAHLHVLINSGGGYLTFMMELLSVLDAWRDGGGRVFTYAKDVAASAATKIFFAGDERIALPETRFLWHVSIDESCLARNGGEVTRADLLPAYVDLHRSWVRSVIREARVPACSDRMRRDFHKSINHPERVREDLAWNANFLATAGLIRVVPDAAALGEVVLSNIGGDQSFRGELGYMAERFFTRPLGYWYR